MLCPYCKNEMPDDARFCWNCGKHIDVSNNSFGKTKKKRLRIGSEANKSNRAGGEESNKRLRFLLMASLAIIVALIGVLAISASDFLKDPQSKNDYPKGGQEESFVTEADEETSMNEKEAEAETVTANDSDNEMDTESSETSEFVYPTEWPSEVYTYGGHSYAFYNAKKYDLATYSAVCNFCREQGGHLAVINDQDENDYLYNLMTENYDHTVFFGYSDENREGRWEWDGDESTYENWTQWGDWDLPDNGSSYGGDEDYAEFNFDTIHDWSPRDGTWNDASFRENTDIFICEWEYELR